MNKRILATAVMAATMAWGAIVNAGNQNIRWTVHNLSSSAPINGRHFISTDTDQICIFCHTPHHAQPAQPLWNKVNPTQSFRMYTSSSTLSSVAKEATQPGPESLLCLSCHDGRTAINVLHNGNVGIDADGAPGGDRKVRMSGKGYDDANNPNDQALSLNMEFMFGDSYRANLGKRGDSEPEKYAGDNLMDDHPISFSYAAAQGEKGSGALHPIETAKLAGLRFFGPNRDRLECSTCHDPHVDYGMAPSGGSGGRTPSGSPTGDATLTPFLVRNNDGSSMCLACHNK